MIAERDYFGLSPIRTHEIYTEDQEEKERLRTRVGELEDELEKESR